MFLPCFEERCETRMKNNCDSLRFQAISYLTWYFCQFSLFCSTTEVCCSFDCQFESSWGQLNQAKVTWDIRPLCCPKTQMYFFKSFWRSKVWSLRCGWLTLTFGEPIANPQDGVKHQDGTNNDLQAAMIFRCKTSENRKNPLL